MPVENKTVQYLLLSEWFLKQINFATLPQGKYDLQKTTTKWYQEEKRNERPALVWLKKKQKQTWKRE